MRPRTAFTLIELILVMAVLATVFSLGAPMLSKFFRGRTLEEEGQRFLALTRYGQSCAVSEGVPMIQWLNVSDGSYGLKVQDGFNTGNTSSSGRGEDRPAQPGRKPVNFRLPERLRFELEKGVKVENQIATIRFAPDGSIDEYSLKTVVIQQEDEGSVTIVQSENRLKYVIQQKGNDAATATE